MDICAKSCKMTALQLNAEIYRSLGVIAEDESALAKVSKYLRRVAKSITDDPPEMTKEEYMAKLERSKEQARKGQVYHFEDPQQMLNWLNSL